MTSKSRRSSGHRAPVFFLVFILFLLGLYTAYWFYVRSQVTTIIDGWIDDQRALGTEITYQSRSMSGYPYRISLAFNDFEYRAADGSTDWSGEKFQFTMPAWNFRHYIVRSPGRNSLLLETGERVDIDLLGRSAASITLQSDNTLKAVTLAVDDAQIQTVLGRSTINDLGLKFGVSDVDPDHARLAVDWEEITVPTPPTGADWLGTQLPNGALRVEFEGLGPYLSQPNGLADWRRDTREIEIAQALINYGPVEAGMKGKLDLSPEGLFNGPLLVRLDNGETLIDALEANGLMSPLLRPVLDGILNRSDAGAFANVPVRDSVASYFGFRLFEIPPIPAPGQSG